jgi:hypothetical protein
VDLSKLSKSEWAWLLRRESNSPIKLARVENVWNFLKEEKAQILRDSYIAFLAAQDIAEYFNVTNENNEKSLTQLKSEQELADFENREILSNPLFTEERFWGFFLKYSKIKYFFTGMFVYNLLRDQKTQ